MSYGSTDQRGHKVGSIEAANIRIISAQTEEVRGLLTQNIEKVVQRGEKLDDLGDRADKLMHDSGQFHSSTRALKRKLWWQRTRLWVILIIIILVILLVIGASVGIPLGLKYGKKK